MFDDVILSLLTAVRHCLQSVYGCVMYRVIQILRAASDGCRSRPWLVCWPASGPLYSRSFQTLTLLFQFIFPVDGHAETLAFTDCDYCYVSAVSVVIVIIAICDIPRQEFSLCERVCIFTIRICNFSNFVALCTDVSFL